MSKMPIRLLQFSSLVFIILKLTKNVKPEIFVSLFTKNDQNWQNCGFFGAKIEMCLFMINVARFTRNVVKRDFFSDFQTL